MKIRKLTIIILMLTLLLFPFLSHDEVYAAHRSEYLKVGLKFGSSSVASCTITAEEGFLLGAAEDRRFEDGMPLPAYTKLVVANENGNIVIRDEEGTLLSADLGASGCIMPYDYNENENAILYYENTPYRDGVMFAVKSDGTLTVINYITLEHYVYGVLNCELGYTNPIEALKAQAVAARSFGELNLGKHSADGFDLCSGTHCQVYKGYSAEYPSIIEAVDETEGEMIRYNGEPVNAFYFKNSGGYTQNAEDVWANALPYIKAVKDEYCPSYPWSTSLSFDAIEDKLEAAGYRPGTVESLSITRRNETGAVSELTIRGSGDTVILTKEKIRSVLGATIIKSNRFDLVDSVSSGGSSGWKISSGDQTEAPGSKLYVINGSGEIKKISSDEAYCYNGTSTEKLGGGSSAVETVTGGVANLNGFGYGHGVGMPQDSAVEMAKQGFTYDEILKYFFTDIEVD